jgi:hypothetical protein
MCEYISKNVNLPSQKAKDHKQKSLREWVNTQKKNYNSQGVTYSKCIMKTTPEIWQIWTDTLSDEKYSEALIDPVQRWKNKHTQMCLYISKNIKLPTQTPTDPDEKILRQWINTQKKNYNSNDSNSSKCIMNTHPEIWQIWTETLADPKYNAALTFKNGRPANMTSQVQQSPSSPSSPSYPSHPPPIKLKPRLVIKKSHLIPNPSSLECSTPETNTSTPNRVITDSLYKLTGRAWSSQKSTTTHEKLQSIPAEWHAYHYARDISFQGYTDQSQIPRNRVIAHLANKRKHRLRILDLGCGRNNIAQHYANADKNHKFNIQGYDHIAEEGSGALVGNIADLAAQEEDESADICIYSQSLMGSDWRDYLTEGHRMLRYNGEFIISEHIKLLDDVRAELGRLGCKIESVNADADTSAADAAVEAEDADDKVAKWFVLVARKV